MSFFVRLADRGGFAPRNQRAPVLTPKGGPVRRMPAAPPEAEETALPLRRQETGEEELRTLRRAQEEEVEPLRRVVEDQEETAAPLRRQEDREERAQALRRREEEEEVQPVRRQPEGPDEEELRSLRRQEEDEEAQPLRRQAEGEAEEARPLRRQEDEQADQEEQAQPLRRQGEAEEIEPARISRAGRPSEPELDPDEAREPEPPLDVPEPSDLRALRRDIAGGPAHAPRPRPDSGTPAGSDPVDGATDATGHAAEPFAPPSFPAPAPPSTQSGGGDRFERPHVVIDQVDVLVHEPATPATARPPATGRRIRARYLRRL